jgi:hypothetical protein
MLHKASLILLLNQKMRLSLSLNTALPRIITRVELTVYLLWALTTINNLVELMIRRSWVQKTLTIQWSNKQQINKMPTSSILPKKFLTKRWTLRHLSFFKSISYRIMRGSIKSEFWMCISKILSEFKQYFNNHLKWEIQTLLSRKAWMILQQTTLI